MNAPVVTLLLAAVLFSACDESTTDIVSEKQPPNLTDYDAAAARRAPQKPIDLPDSLRKFVRMGYPITTEGTFGVPTFVWASDAATDAVETATRGPVSAETKARAYLDLFAPLYRQSEDGFSKASLRYLHDTGWGPIIAKYHMEIDGLPVFGQSVNVMMARDLSLTAVSGFLSPNGSDDTNTDFELDFEEATAAAYRDLTGESLTADLLRETSPRGRFHFVETIDSASDRTPKNLASPIQMHRVLYPLPDRLAPAYYLVLQLKTPLPNGSDSYGYIISGTDGTVLKRQNLVSHDFSYRVWADAQDGEMPHPSPHGSANSPHPTRDPDDSPAPPYTDSRLVTLNAGPISTGDPWLPEGAQETVGNNVDAYVDRFEGDGLSLEAGDFRARVTASGTFDHAYDLTDSPTANTTQQMAVVTQLFYTINYLHDWFYDAGFDEAAGNAQADNYGRGGEEGDVLRAEAQDYSGTNNANMSTPPDGYSPRMQQYLFALFEPLSLIVTAPEYIAGTYNMAGASFGPESYDVTAEVVRVDDGIETGSDGCEPFGKDGAFVGRIALVNRGNCTFVQKTENAQAALAVGLIVVDYPDTVLSDMGGIDDGTVEIPAVKVDDAAGAALLDVLGWGDTPVVRLFREERDEHRGWRDSGIDNSIVAHEWGHYLHQRLTDSGSNQSRAVSEGWGDFLSLLIAVKEGDDTLPGNEGFGGVYSSFSGYADNEYYYTIRRYPLSTDMARYNPLTLGHIADSASLPDGPPSAPGPNNAEVHAAGEIWSAAMWELYVSLLTRPDLSFDEARERMKTYIVAGMKMTPTDATFTESRDALLAAAAATDPVDFDRFAAAFAKRGFGDGAVSPERYSKDFEGVEESFVPMGETAGLTFEGATLTEAASCDNDGVLDAGETAVLTVRIRNSGGAALESTTAAVTASVDATLSNGGVIEFPPARFGESVEGSIAVTPGASATAGTLEIELSFSDPVVGLDGPTEQVSFEMNADIVPNSSFTETASDTEGPWSTVSEIGTRGVWGIVVSDGDNRVWYAPDASELSDQSLVSPPLEVDETDALIITFDHRYEFESAAWDGGVIELSTDDGATWNDLGNRLARGYDGPIIDSNNPLTGRVAYIESSPDYPAFVSETIDLSDAGLAGETVRIRFRIGCDAAVGAHGWEIDNIHVAGVATPPFSVLVAESDACSPAAEIVLLGATDLTTSEAGGTAEFSVRLNAEPSATVTLPISVSDVTEAGVSPSEITFGTDDWFVPRTVTVTGLDDDTLDGDIPYTVDFGVVESSDSVYAAMDLSNAGVAVTNLDDDGRCPTALSASAQGPATIGGAVTLTFSGEYVQEWEIRYGLNTEEERGFLLPGDQSEYVLENLNATDSTVTVRAHGRDGAQAACFDAVIVPLEFADASGENITQTPDSTVAAVPLGTAVLIGVTTDGATSATVNGAPMIPDDDTLPRVNHWTFPHRALANESLEIAVFAPGDETPTVVGTTTIQLANGTCPSGTTVGFDTTAAQIGAPISLTLTGENAGAFEVTYNGETALAFDGAHTVSRAVGDRPTLSVRALGTDPDGAPCEETVTVPLPFETPTADSRTQIPDMGETGAAYGTRTLLSVETTGAIAVSVDGTPMVPDEDPTVNRTNRWTLFHEVTETRVLPIALTAPGETNPTAGGEFRVVRASGGCPENLDRTWIYGESLLDSIKLGAPATVLCDGDNVETFEVFYGGTAVAVANRAWTLHDQTDYASDDGVVAQTDDIYGGIYSCEVADDFTVPQGAWWQLASLTVLGSEDGPTDTADVTIYRADNGALPGTQLRRFEAAPAQDDGVGNLRIALDSDGESPLLLGPGTYWAAISTVKEVTTTGIWYAAVSTAPNGHPAVWRNPGNGWMTGCTDWSPLSECQGVGPDIAFEVSGIAEDGRNHGAVAVIDAASADIPTVTVRGIGRDADGSPCESEVVLPLYFEEAAVRNQTQSPSSIPDGLTAGTRTTLRLETVGASAVALDGAPMTPTFDPAITRINTWTAMHTVAATSETLPVTVTTPGESPDVAPAEPFRIRAICDKVVCGEPAACRTEGVCDPDTGTCDYDSVEDGTHCDDGNRCTRADRCWFGVCAGGDPVLCECTINGGCDPDSGMCLGDPAPDGTPCSDGFCEAGECRPGDGGVPDGGIPEDTDTDSVTEDDTESDSFDGVDPDTDVDTADTSDSDDGPTVDPDAGTDTESDSATASDTDSDSEETIDSESETGGDDTDSAPSDTAAENDTDSESDGGIASGGSDDDCGCRAPGHGRGDTLSVMETAFQLLTLF